MSHVLSFEKPVVELVSRVRELRVLAEADRKFEPELRRLEEKASRLARELFADLTPWQKVQLSRHPDRPYTLDYIGAIFEDFVELHGDRSFSDDASIVGGVARFRETSRGHIMGLEHGMLKMLFSLKTRRVLGVGLVATVAVTGEGSTLDQLAAQGYITKDEYNARRQALLNQL